MYSFKILQCPRRYVHDWSKCPYAHKGEVAARRDPRKFLYWPEPCPDASKNPAKCPRGRNCAFSHSVFEYWLHPARYRTQMCSIGANCKRTVCFFAHNASELRAPTYPPMPMNLYCLAAGQQPMELGGEADMSDVCMLTEDCIMGCQPAHAHASNGCHQPQQLQQQQQHAWVDNGTLAGGMAGAASAYSVGLVPCQANNMTPYTASNNLTLFNMAAAGPVQASTSSSHPSLAPISPGSMALSAGGSGNWAEQVTAAAAAAGVSAPLSLSVVPQQLLLQQQSLPSPTLQQQVAAIGTRPGSSAPQQDSCAAHTMPMLLPSAEAVTYTTGLVATSAPATPLLEGYVLQHASSGMSCMSETNPLSGQLAKLQLQMMTAPASAQGQCYQQLPLAHALSGCMNLACVCGPMQTNMR